MLYLNTALYVFHLTPAAAETSISFLFYILFAAAAWSLSDYFLRSDLFFRSRVDPFSYGHYCLAVVGSPILPVLSALSWGFQAESGAKFGYGALAVLVALALLGIALKR